VGAESLHSPTWGFRIDLPEEFYYTGGDGRNSFAFDCDAGVSITLRVYARGAYPSVQRLAEDVKTRLSSSGDIDYFEYNNKKAAIVEIAMTISGEALSGWGLCVSLGDDESSSPFLAALAYGPGNGPDLSLLYLSCLDSIVPTDAERRYPGPITSYIYPRDTMVQKTIAGINVPATVGSSDEIAAQAIVDREFAVLRRYQDSPQWKEAWLRFYRAIFRDSYVRLTDIAFAFERDWYTKTQGGSRDPQADNAWEFAQYTLTWIQGFAYERNLLGSDFVNVVSAALDGRGDCDSRAMLWAIMLERNNIVAAMMVSRDYSHAMGLVLLESPTAVPRASFQLGGYNWIVAETTDRVDIGRIQARVSDPAFWLGIPFD
jgi:hypothetical protein